MPLSRRIALFVALIGAGVCSYNVIGFFRVIVGNRLPWSGTDKFTREHYQAVGESYSQGFAVGFFLCFFLATIAVIVGTWYEARRDRKRAALRAGPRASPPPSPVQPGSASLPPAGAPRRA